MDASQIDVKTRLDLLDLPQKASDAANWSNAEQYIDCFAEDGIWDPRPLWPTAMHGKPAIREAFEQAWASLEFALQAIYSVRIIEFSGQHARLRTYLGEFGRAKGQDTAPIGFGMYEDDCVLEDGIWRIKLHKLTPLYYGSADWLHPIHLNCPPGR